MAARAGRAARSDGGGRTRGVCDAAVRSCDPRSDAAGLSGMEVCPPDTRQSPVPITCSPPGMPRPRASSVSKVARMITSSNRFWEWSSSAASGDPRRRMDRMAIKPSSPGRAKHPDVVSTKCKLMHRLQSHPVRVQVAWTSRRGTGTSLHPPRRSRTSLAEHLRRRPASLRRARVDAPPKNRTRLHPPGASSRSQVSATS